MIQFGQVCNKACPVSLLQFFLTPLPHTRGQWSGQRKPFIPFKPAASIAYAEEQQSTCVL